MVIATKEVRVATNNENDIVDLTGRVQEAVKESNLADGVVTVFVTGSTAAVTTIEFEPGLVKDFSAMLERQSPRDLEYEHQKAWNDNNGHSHVKASLVGPSLTVPFIKGKLALGTWQQVILVELDIRPRMRTVVLQIVGE